MDKNGILTPDEKESIMNHLREVGIQNCNNCSGSTKLELIDQVVAVRFAETKFEHETYLVSVKCVKCKVLRFYPAIELGVTRSE